MTVIHLVRPRAGHDDLAWLHELSRLRNVTNTIANTDDATPMALRHHTNVTPSRPLPQSRRPGHSRRHPTILATLVSLQHYPGWSRHSTTVAIYQIISVAPRSATGAHRSATGRHQISRCSIIYGPYRPGPQIAWHHHKTSAPRASRPIRDHPKISNQPGTTAMTETTIKRADDGERRATLRPSSLG